MSEAEGQIGGFGKPPKAGRFQKGRSGNPRGRPRDRTKGVPYDYVLGQMVTIRENGREVRVTAAEAFLLQLTKKGLEGCNSSARASLVSIEQAQAELRNSVIDTSAVRFTIRSFGLCCIVEDLGMATKFNATSVQKVRLKLKPWIVQTAVNRMTPDQLNVGEQAKIVAATRTPYKVVWPDWWAVRH